MSGKVLIIGNGFDLDLGMNTRYSDFAKSKIWENTFHDDLNVYDKSTLIGFLYAEKEKQGWFDVEQSLLDYALQKKSENFISETMIDEDKAAYHKLSQALSMYLQKEQDAYTPKNCVASQVLEAIISNGYFRSIYSFNYTSLAHIARLNKMSLGESKVIHVHGDLANNDIILGIMADTSVYVPDCYSFFYKDNSLNYHSNNMAKDLEDADELVFFGHSINGMDFDYFKDFFTKQAGMKGENKRKKITIFTYDENSDMKIRNSIRKIGISPRHLFNKNDLCFIHTSNLKDGNQQEQNAFDSFLKHLREDSESAHLMTIASLL